MPGNSHDREAAEGGRPLVTQSLLRAASFPHAVANLRLKETHISWVLLTGYFAYKIKKPVRYPFLDASTLERRRALCEDELRLNKRMAPDLYVEVVPITLHDNQLQIGGKGTPVEYAVQMHEFESSQELSHQLGEGQVTLHDMAVFAARLADLHDRAAAAEATGPYGDFSLVRMQMLDNFAPLRKHLRDPAAAELIEWLARWTGQALLQQESLIRSRKLNGRVRECHGDLHARNIVRWRQHWTPFDCIEFDPQLRWIDVMSDVAFLFMDLIAHGRRDLAYEFLSRYLEVAGDYPGLRLLALYCAYRALVRAKVDALNAESSSSETAHALEMRLLDRLKTAVGFTNRPVPFLILMHGVTACGKSWLSERLVPTVHAVRIRSDLERKRLAGVAPLSRRQLGVREGNYSAAFTESTYARLLSAASDALDAGINVIVDASFLDRKYRQLFQALAGERRCKFLIASCHADRSTLETRLKQRASYGLDPSEATPAVLEEQLRSADPLVDEEKELCTHIDTSWLTSAEAGVLDVKTRLAESAHG